MINIHNDTNFKTLLWMVLVITIYLITYDRSNKVEIKNLNSSAVQCSLGSGRFVKACVFDANRFRWYPIAVYRRNHDLTFLQEKSKEKYNPNYGYEPYWADGDWVLTQTPSGSTEPGLACGEECHDMFYKFGQICGRGKNYTHKTFENYCELLNQDCTGREKWMIAYRGPCQEELKTRPTRQKDLIPRAEKYIKDFEINNPSTVKLKFKTHHSRTKNSTKAHA